MQLGTGGVKAIHLTLKLYRHKPKVYVTLVITHPGSVGVAAGRSDQSRQLRAALLQTLGCSALLRKAEHLSSIHPSVHHSGPALFREADNIKLQDLISILIVLN